MKNWLNDFRKLHWKRFRNKLCIRNSFPTEIGKEILPQIVKSIDGLNIRQLGIPSGCHLGNPRHTAHSLYWYQSYSSVASCEYEIRLHDVLIEWIWSCPKTTYCKYSRQLYFKEKSISQILLKFLSLGKQCARGVFEDLACKQGSMAVYATWQKLE